MNYIYTNAFLRIFSISANFNFSTRKIIMKMTVALVSLLLAACASAPKTDSSQAPGTDSTQASQSNAIAKPTESEKNAQISTAETESSRLASEAQALQKQSVYFDFDRFAVKPEYRDVIQQQAAFIKAHKNDIVTLEGNADERGSNEYNLALGDKRANAVRKNLELLGVSAAQIRAVSMGEEKPRLSCHEERCWKENRRNDFIHKFN